MEGQPDGTECWVLEGKKLPLADVVSVGATLPDRTLGPRRWEDVPDTVHAPSERLKAMDVDGVDYSVLYPSIAGLAGETFGRFSDQELELACVQAYNDWLIEEWASASERFIPQWHRPYMACRRHRQGDKARRSEGAQGGGAASRADAPARRPPHQRA